ncbi:MAG: A/G-specific adenine glycosylase [Dehalococcoidia bacterium]|nr:A/G-specific adenine glycosylase [Dehalococcoidia bacterium]
MAKHRKTNLLRETANPLPLREEVEWFRERIMEWAAENGRDFPWRHTDDEYRIVVTEILLQQTTATAVSRLYDTFYQRLPDWQSLNEICEAELRRLIGVLGLGNQRGKRLKALAAWMADHGWHLPSTRDELEDVPGIGQYVASSLLAVKYGRPEPLLDVNMTRVLERFFGVRERADIRDDPWLQQVGRLIAPDPATGWAVLDFASAVCRSAESRCETCPAVERCYWMRR